MGVVAAEPPSLAGAEVVASYTIPSTVIVFPPAKEPDSVVIKEMTLDCLPSMFPKNRQSLNTATSFATGGSNAADWIPLWLGLV